jgi:hypothetical protein
MACWQSRELVRARLIRVYKLTELTFFGDLPALGAGRGMNSQYFRLEVFMFIIASLLHCSSASPRMDLGEETVQAERLAFRGLQYLHMKPAKAVAFPVVEARRPLKLTIPY